MSLLSNLIAFSSVNTPAQRQERASSASCRFLLESDDSSKNAESLKRVLSKSLSKMGLLSNNAKSKIDPKQRCLLRIFHSLSMKVRKLNYDFFVRLQAIKKSNSNLNKSTKIEKDILEPAIARVCQTLQICQLKHFENTFKRETFNRIHSFSLKAQLPKYLDKVITHKQYKVYTNKFMAYLSDLHKLQMRMQLMQSAIEIVAKKQRANLTKYAWLLFTKIVPSKPQVKSISIFELVDNKNTAQAASTRKNRFSLDDFMSIKEQSFEQSNKNTNSTDNNFRSKSKSPFKSCKQILNFRQSIGPESSLDTFTYPKVNKSYHITMKYQQQPLHLQTVQEIIPKMITKIQPQELKAQQVSDYADKSNIFRDFKPSRVAQLESLQISSVVAEPFARVQSILRDLERNRYEANSNSGLSYSPYLNNQASISSINQRDESSFSCDAVNFKNSLVQERQSMKKNQRQKIDIFLKKKPTSTPSQLEQQIRLPSKIFTSQSKQRVVSFDSTRNSLEPSFARNSDYQSKKQTSIYEPNNYLPLQNNYSTSTNWNHRRSQLDYQTETKPKSLSFSNGATEPLIRRLKYNNGSELQKRAGELLMPNCVQFMHSNITTSREQAQSWMGEISQSKVEPAVRDTTIQPISRLRMKTNSLLAVKNQAISSEVPTPKKFINLSKK